MKLALTIIRAAAGWLLLVPAGLLIWEMNTPSMTFPLLPPAYGLMFGIPLLLHFGARLALKRIELTVEIR